MCAVVVVVAAAAVVVVVVVVDGGRGWWWWMVVVDGMSSVGVVGAGRRPIPCGQDARVQPAPSAIALPP
jgi:hypothetical protein